MPGRGQDAGLTRPFTFQLQRIGAELGFFAALGQEPEIELAPA